MLERVKIWELLDENECILGVFINLFVYSLAILCELWDLNFPTRDWTWALGSESAES